MLKRTSGGQPLVKEILSSKLHRVTLGLIQSSSFKSGKIEIAATWVKSLQITLFYCKLNIFPVIYLKIFFCTIRVRRWKQPPSLKGPLVSPNIATPH